LWHESISPFHQELETLLRDHPPENRERIESLTKELINNHIMVSIVKTRLDQYTHRADDIEGKVRREQRVIHMHDKSQGAHNC
jgi:hypothetical protein